MYAKPTMVLMDTWSVDDATTVLSGMAERAVVVVQQSGADKAQYYALDVGSVLAALDEADPDDELASALDLALFPANRTFDLVDDFDKVPPPRPGDVLLRNVEVVGVLQADPGDDTSRGEVDAEPWPTAATPTDEAAATPPARRRFRAFAALEAPEAVLVAQRFQLSAGLSNEPMTDDDEEQPIIVPGAPEELTFVVQIAGFGFTFPDGIRRTLTVQRDDPMGVTVDFTVVPTQVKNRATRTLEVSFEYDGERCGQAWHDIVVSRPADSDTPEPSERTSGGTGVTLAVDGRPPSLTVEIRTEPGTSELEWIFHTKDGVPRPEGPVRTRLDQPSAQAFAEWLMAEVPKNSQPRVARGLGKMVNIPVPTEFWDAVEATWRHVPHDETPSLLIITGDPFIPWELAWVDADSVDPALYQDEGPLGALWRVGRWVPPVRHRRGPDRPAVPPPTNIDVDALAVVIGDFATDKKVRELRYAVEEGRSIAERYDGLPLTVDADDVARLMNAELERDTRPFAPQAVHFASHGETDLEHQQNTGVILSGGRRLDIMWVQETRIGGVSAPFVFLNACQVGTASRVLSSYGGLAGAFLGTGCRGFLAPLWNVDDKDAKEIALEFYASTLQDGLTVGEALRRIREGFRDGAKQTATQLAYVFYGHPELEMNWSHQEGE